MCISRLKYHQRWFIETFNKVIPKLPIILDPNQIHDIESVVNILTDSEFLVPIRPIIYYVIFKFFSS